MQGTASGIPTVAAPNLGGLAAASAAYGAAANAAEDLAGRRRQARTNLGLPSIITVEVIGYASDNPDREERQRRRSDRQSRYDPNSTVRVVGNGEFTQDQKDILTEQDEAKLDRLIG